MASEVFLYVPNIIGYIRILLLLIGWWCFNCPPIFVPCYVISIILDGLDGYAARRLNQVSEFGAWLDVVIDNLGRGMLWSALFEWGYFVSALEWCVFVCTHSCMGAEWKSRFGCSPWWIQRVTANGFKSPLGVLCISGLHVLPVWLYGYQKGVLTEVLFVPFTLQCCGIAILTAGRLLCFAVEVWCLGMHIKFLTRTDQKTKEKD
ncbi:CDP-diacylglycerol--glycerol-3-phosphate 3-phosphatidyltransferase isoform X2 [Acipenser oxyrinchus oxyrinchus]|uniref:CDP-diacylglycerol--glycerol-3-phosphate 3-phosphatidyltransferase isoform X2 n=1 Tax=Acipenser oxyrinchus oxyrinchus TaxID=40147 RepID=A0AAD8FVM4_ACIOX|nr:CDP-diacylglycerol--glycerol-3-phosphate 3-phosphatidyltransferase isoform X2 [Acipenser oxyrinchus oxyrinchus]KAK1158208.1 CDP-diacylglycerol--glycerol-3-phosphate 3-phosphatidyltransferase isoform X2 [Acipenser oxyrinchus oxyrinchus]